MKKIITLLMVLFLANATAPAQSNKFEWDDWTCTYEGTYNKSLYTEKQLKNTYSLWHTSDFNMELLEAAAFDLEGIKKLRTIESIEAEYKSKSASLKALEIVNVPYWKEFKENKMKALEQDYRLARSAVRAYQDPAALREVTFAGACVEKFAPPLIAGGDDPLGFWRELNEKSRAQNGDPERVGKKFEAKMASADRLKYAQLEVITFGWWNCVNAEIRRPEEKLAPETNFKKLFKTVKQTFCDEP